MRKSASGNFVLRLSATVHEALRREASSKSISLNSVCARVLEDHVNRAAAVTSDESRSPVIREIEELFGDSLLGVMLFGSTARGESTEESDVDLLVVLDETVPLNRGLYSRWDERFADGRRSPHFVHVPRNAEDAGSIWLEASVEGTVLFEREVAVSRFLGRIRRMTASGALKRLYAHGHPYWVKTEGVSDRAE